ncbi:MAG TPA: GtrA family protein [Gammaproteobacteria bacterium]|nr:GtrA family protein [Gammaproteobacteria bacterium]
MSRQLLAFTLVGLFAAGIHFCVVSAIVPFGVSPLVANVVGFLAAFGFSFVGHNHWSFPSSNRARGPALMRFFAVASTSLVLNETLYLLLLQFTELSYQIALVVVLAVVATLTLVASKYWAFADVAR